MPTSPRKLVTLGVLCSLFLCAMETSVVGTAAPRIIREIGGLDSYSWMFTAYLITATLSMPLWGRFADQLGRKRLLIAAMIVFLVGSVLCGCARSMNELILYRAIKGFGGGGVFPLAFTIIADIYPYKERGRIQGYLSSVWGIASIIGPFIGGGLTEILGWRSIFFITLVPGIAAIWLIGRFFRETYAPNGGIKLSISSLLTSTGAVAALLIALKFFQMNLYTIGGSILLVSISGFFTFYLSEKTAAHPLIPQVLVGNRVFTVTCITGFFSSMLVIGLSSFGPLLFQSVMGLTPTASGLMLVPFTIAWVIGSIVSTRLLATHHYRALVLLGNWITFGGISVFMALFYELDIMLICLTTIVMGVGMSFIYPIAIITTQHSVPADQVGFATSGVAWVRNLGTTIGTTVMGVVLSLVFQRRFLESVPNAGSELVAAIKQHPEVFFQGNGSGLIPEGVDVTAIFHQALLWVFGIKFAAVTMALAISYFFPKKSVHSSS